ncbi:MAG: HAMP domain-containing sensor histidine kinase [Chthoniobacteraceae bacterium]
MKARRPSTLVEWGFILLMTALCATITILQYRWTGEVSTAEETRLHASLREQVQALTNAFDAELSESCSLLAPAGRELTASGREQAHARRLLDWASQNRRPIFKRLAVAVPGDSELQLFQLDQKTGASSPMPWPAEWRSLHDNLWQKATHSSEFRPFEDPQGLLLQTPVFGGSTPGENEWMIYELDRDYLAKTWIPELVKTYLATDESQPPTHIEIRTTASPGTIIFSDLPKAASGGEQIVSLTFNHGGLTLDDPRARPDDFRWLLEAHRMPGALKVVVTENRRRNFALACVVNGLILISGFALLRHTRRSRELAAAQMNFVANVSHELRTPLTVIRGAAYNLTRGVIRDPARVEQYARLIVQHAEQLGEMVEQVLALAGASSSRGIGKFHPVAIAEVLHEAIAVTAQDVQASGNIVEFQPPGAFPKIAADATALGRVFQNLITNAAKHGTPAAGNGRILITARVQDEKAGRWVEIRVRDHGPGIPESERAQIFSPFYRGTLAREKQTRGSGLGLNLVREIVQAHRGRVTIEETPGGGATFLVRLPAMKNEVVP